MHISALLIALLVAPLVRAASFGHPLAKRQISVGTPSPLPSQCTSTCSPVNSEISLGCPVEACCGTTFENEYYNCLICIGNALDAGNYTTLQNSLNLLYTTCVDMGFVLPRLELPGQSNSTSTAGSGGSSPTGQTSGAAAEARWRVGQIEALVGVTVFLGIIGAW